MKDQYREAVGQKVKLLTLKVVWLEASKSTTQSMTAGGTIVMVWKE
jgi:hypothetical protein